MQDMWVSVDIVNAGLLKEVDTRDLMKSAR